MNTSWSLAELAARLGGRVQGDPETRVSQVAALEHAGPQHISFLNNSKYRAQLAASQAGAVILAEGDVDHAHMPCIVVVNPHAAFARVAAWLNPLPARVPGVHPSAVVAADVELPADVHIGPCVTIAAGASIGAGSVIMDGCHIGDGVRIGARAWLYPGVTIYHGCVLGDDLIVHSGTVIGSDGFGLAWEGDHWSKVPQVGRVVIGNDVEIGANVAIDRGAIDDTVIGNGVKLDNQIHIAHNCRIGDHTVIAGCVGMAGSTRIGAYCQIGGAAQISGHLDICDRVIVSGGTTITKDIREPGVYTSVQPFLKHEDWLRNAVHLRRLDDMAKRIKQLEKQLNTQAERGES
jgi:UDP-3-O-[3-hydroxymyristoyl] glucosamine N-acyltransferase